MRACRLRARIVNLHSAPGGTGYKIFKVVHRLNLNSVLNKYNYTLNFVNDDYTRIMLIMI